TSTILDQFDRYDGDPVDFAAPMAIEKYGPDQILVGHGKKVSVVNLDDDDPEDPHFDPGKPTISPPELEIPGIPDEGDYLMAGENPPPGQYPEICGVEIFGSGSSKRICVTAPDGRIWILTHSPIAFARTTQDLPRPDLTEPRPWYSNRSLGHAFTVDDNGQPLEQNVWVDEIGLPYYAIGFEDYARILTFQPATGVVDDFREDVGSAGAQGFMFLNNRGMLLDESTTPAATPSYFAETGVLVPSAAAPTHRYALHGALEPYGGHIFEMPPQGYGGSRIIETFDVPVEPPHTSYNGKAWPYVGNEYIKGQVTVNRKLRDTRGFGNNLAYGPLKRGEIEVDHLIVSTMGGYVYAVDLTQGDPNGLTWRSSDLGWCLMGLAVGDIDHDGWNEVVVGSLVDTGGYTDWYPTPDRRKNRGQLVILETDNPPLPGHFRETVVDISDAMDPAIEYGYGAGVCGIVLDDIDNNGWKEMWVTDSRGYLYVLWYDQAAALWKCVFRSESLGTYAGIYGKIFPFHGTGGGGTTTRLVVWTPGYIYRFEVDASELAELIQ
ncbi:MAG: hypothetical protein AB1486_35090, partial [Planctomycetota bacterium]